MSFYCLFILMRRITNFRLVRLNAYTSECRFVTLLFLFTYEVNILIYSLQYTRDIFVLHSKLRLVPFIRVYYFSFCTMNETPTSIIMIISRVICGITEDTNYSHIVKAALEAVCYQVRDILDAMNEDCGIPLQLLKVQNPHTQYFSTKLINAPTFSSIVPLLDTGRLSEWK